MRVRMMGYRRPAPERGRTRAAGVDRSLDVPRVFEILPVDVFVAEGGVVGVEDVFRHDFSR